MSRRSEALRDQRDRLYAERGGVCETCRCSVPFTDFTLAHRIPEAKWAIRKYGWAVIDHDLNKTVTHRGDCNDAENIQNDPMACDELAAEIRSNT